MIPKVEDYQAPNWFTRLGASRKAKQIKANGIPDLTNWRFITLTVDPQKANFDPETGFKMLREEFPKFIRRMRSEFNPDSRWCRKFEFHSNGWMHCHLFYEYTAKFDRIELEMINHYWGIGRVNVKRVKSGLLDYMLKYITKSITLDDEEPRDCPFPQWFADGLTYQEKHIAEQETDGVTIPAHTIKIPVTYANVRMWQASQKFYTDTKKTDCQKDTDEPSDEKTKKKIQTKCWVILTVQEKFNFHCRKFRLLIDYRDGSKSKVIIHDNGWADLMKSIIILVNQGHAYGESPGVYVINPKKIKYLLNPQQQTLIRKLA